MVMIALAWFCVGYDNEAIRPQLDGRFEDLLLAAVKHPVMLIYLDNIQSIGPDSKVGKRRKRGLNENLAREILELHTLGVDGGYGQDDVIALAKMLTGWTVARKHHTKFGGREGAFFFGRAMHQPGAQQMLGKRYPAGGVEQAEQALSDLAAHPSTARFMATKLARHFVADQPPATVIRVLEKAWLDSGGDLPTVHRALVQLPDVWAAAGNESMRKFRTPWEYLIAAHRGFEMGDSNKVRRALIFGLTTMNHHPFTAEAPTGWPDRAEHWASPNALKQRLEWGIAAGRKLASRERMEMATTHLVPPADKVLQRAMMRAESPGQAISILLASPAFQWR